jgi:protein O-mannosyl-transferase
MQATTFRNLVLLALLLVGSVAYLNTFEGEWVWDDASSVLLHESVQAPTRLLHEGAGMGAALEACQQLFREDQHAYGKGQGNFYRPLVSLSFAADYFLTYRPPLPGAPKPKRTDLDPFVFHGGNLLWHVAAAALLFLLLCRLEAPRFVSAAVALLYVVHPLHTEAVAYISGRADMMSATFIYAALFLCLSPASGMRQYGAWLLALLCFAAGLCSKESTAIFPFILLGVTLLRPREDTTIPVWKETKFLPVALSAIVLIGYVLLRLTLLKFNTAQAGSTPPFSERLMEAGQALAFYLKVLFVPTGLHMEQSLADVPAWTAFVGFLFLAALVLLLITALRHGWARIAMGVVWFIAAWAPISGLFPLNAPMAEHWMYVPMAGFWWALMELLWRGVSNTAPRAQPWATGFAAIAVYALILGFTVLTVQRNQDWHDNERLYTATLKENPDTQRVHYNLAVTYEDLLNNSAGARRHYEAAREILRRAGELSTSDTQTEIRLSLGRVCYRERNYAMALQHFGSILQRSASTNQSVQLQAQIGAAHSLLAMGNLGPAMQYLYQLSTLNPQLAQYVQPVLEGAPLSERATF